MRMKEWTEISSCPVLTLKTKLEGNRFEVVPLREPFTCPDIPLFFAVEKGGLQCQLVCWGHERSWPTHDRVGPKYIR